MNWFEVKISTTAQAVEAVANMLYTLDINGVIIEDPDDTLFYNSNEGDWDYIDINEIKPNIDMPQVKGYLSHIENYDELYEYLNVQMEQINQSGLDVGNFRIEIVKMENTDWENEWKKYYKPFAVGKKLAIKPSWEDITDELKDRIIIEIDPGGAFGSGTHETTYTCMEALEEFITPNCDVIDVGTGSGILSIVSAKLGAGKIVAIDNSYAAYETTVENIQRGGFENIQVIHGNLLDEVKAKADVVVANIIAEVIVMISEYIGKFIKADGVFIASGIINIRKEMVFEALNKYGFEVIKTIEKGEWITIVSKVRNE
jgi:ribosomal protein L11 methyltransferase